MPSLERFLDHYSEISKFEIFQISAKTIFNKFQGFSKGSFHFDNSSAFSAADSK